jgi:hypothetical protein
MVELDNSRKGLGNTAQHADQPSRSSRRSTASDPLTAFPDVSQYRFRIEDRDHQKHRLWPGISKCEIVLPERRAEKVPVPSSRWDSTPAKCESLAIDSEIKGFGLPGCCLRSTSLSNTSCPTQQALLIDWRVVGKDRDVESFSLSEAICRMCRFFKVDFKSVEWTPGRR